MNVGVCRMYRKGMPLKSFLETINAKPLAKRLFISYCHRRVSYPLMLMASLVLPCMDELSMIAHLHTCCNSCS